MLVSLFINDYEAEPESKINLFYAIRWLDGLMNKVKSSTIYNCFVSSLGNIVDERAESEEVKNMAEYDLNTEETIKQQEHKNLAILPHNVKNRLFEMVQEYNQGNLSHIRSETEINGNSPLEGENEPLKSSVKVMLEREDKETYLDVKEVALRKSLILRRISELTLNLALHIPKLPKKIKTTLLDIESFVLSKGKLTWKQMTYKVYLIWVKKNGNKSTK